MQNKYAIYLRTDHIIVFCGYLKQKIQTQDIRGGHASSKKELSHKYAFYISNLT